MRDVEEIIQQIRSDYPVVKVRQLQVSHLGMDDDGLWFFEQPDSAFVVQIESPQGMCPFLIETEESDARFNSTSIGETIDIVLKLLHLAQKGTA